VSTVVAVAAVLVTGGTGLLGRRLVPELLERGHRVRVLARHVDGIGDGVEPVQGDVRSRERVGDAMRGMDIVVHAATNVRRGMRATEIEGTRNVVDAVERHGGHLIYVSIVGVDRHRFPYYKAKLAAEQVVESSRCSWTIQRATQFHDLLDMFLAMPVFIRTAKMAFQVVDARDVARRLAEIADTGPPSGRVPDFGGPEILPIRDLAASRREITGRRARLLPVPRIGFLRDFDDGQHLCPDHCDGRISWQEWLYASRASS
jgi:uncharacterized protein YbjT (DUF2867 family)